MDPKANFPTTYQFFKYLDFKINMYLYEIRESTLLFTTYIHSKNKFIIDYK